ncbi:MAG: hypothetical protein OIF36_01160 [Alphaproteobacteria bacterium]|nr:hypothetical protein [Alphaproteobacteria bacterium]
MLGIFLSILLSFVQTVSAMLTQQFKAGPDVLAIYRGLGLAIIIMPFLIFIPHPTSLMFYALALCNGIIASASFRKTSRVINKYGADITSKLLTIPPVIIAIAWWIITPSKFLEFTSNTPYKATGAALCLIGMIFTIFALGYNKKTHKAVLKSIPIFIFYTLQAFLTFFALKYVTYLQAISYYTCIQALLIGTINYLMHIRHLKGHVKEDLLLNVFDKKIMKSGITFTLIVLLSKILMNSAFKAISNPSYVNLIVNTQIIWIVLLEKKLKIKSKIPPKKGIILAIFAIIFIVLTF